MVVIPGGCTSKLQPLDVAINRPYKDILRRCWQTYILNEAATFKPEERQRLPAPSKQEVTNWIIKAQKDLSVRMDLIERSFKCCGISNHLNGCEDNLKGNEAYLQALFEEDSDDDCQDQRGIQLIF